MSDMIEYDISISPSPAEIDLKVAISGTAVSATVVSVPSVTFSLTPTGNLIQKILSAVAWPIAAIVAAACKDKPKSILEGQTRNLGSVPPYDTNGIRITPGDVVLGSAAIGDATMLKVTASLTITPIA